MGAAYTWTFTVFICSVGEMMMDGCFPLKLVQENLESKATLYKCFVLAF